MKRQKGIGNLVGGFISLFISNTILSSLRFSFETDDELQKIMKEKIKQMEKKNV